MRRSPASTATRIWPKLLSFRIPRSWRACRAPRVTRTWWPKYDLGVHARAPGGSGEPRSDVRRLSHRARDQGRERSDINDLQAQSRRHVRPLSRRSRDHQPRIEAERAGVVPRQHPRSGARESGLIVALACGDCHRTHDILRRATPRARSTGRRCRQRAARVMRALAVVCRQRPRRALREACRARRRARRATRRTASSAPSASWQLGAVEECGTCHAEALRTYRDTFHGQVQSPASRGSRSAPTAIRRTPSIRRKDPRSSVSPANVVATCRQCHPSATENVVGRSARRQTRPGAVAARLLRGAGHERAARRCVHLLRPAHDAVVLARISRAAISGRSGATE